MNKNGFIPFFIETNKQRLQTKLKWTKISIITHTYIRQNKIHWEKEVFSLAPS